MTRSGESWSNFWGSLSEMGFYARSHDYMIVVKNSIRYVYFIWLFGYYFFLKEG